MASGRSAGLWRRKAASPDRRAAAAAASCSAGQPASQQQQQRATKVSQPQGGKQRAALPDSGNGNGLPCARAANGGSVGRWEATPPGSSSSGVRPLRRAAAQQRQPLRTARGRSNKGCPAGKPTSQQQQQPQTPKVSQPQGAYLPPPPPAPTDTTQTVSAELGRSHVELLIDRHLRAAEIGGMNDESEGRQGGGSKEGRG